MREVTTSNTSARTTSKIRTMLKMTATATTTPNHLPHPRYVDLSRKDTVFMKLVIKNIVPLFCRLFQNINCFRYDTKTEEEISEIQRKMIHECSDVLAIPHHDSLMLLQCFDWNLVNAQSSWYENESKTRARAGMRTSMTGDPLTLSRIGQCRICKRICKPAAAATEKKVPVISPLPAGKAVGSTIKIVGRHLKKLTEDSFDYNLPDESNPFKVEVTFPCRGMWAGLTANICIDISDKYPMLPPTVTYLTPSSMLHPNIDDSGTICIPNLTPQEWSPTNNLSDVCEAMGKIFEIPDWGNVAQ